MVELEVCGWRFTVDGMGGRVSPDAQAWAAAMVRTQPKLARVTLVSTSEPILGDPPLWFTSCMIDGWPMGIVVAGGAAACDT